MQATRERIRIALDVSKADALQDKLTLSTPDFWRGTDVQFEIGLFYGETLLDVSNLQQIRLVVRESTTDPAGTIVMDKTISTFDNTLAQDTWDADTKQHGLISFTNVETNFSIGAGVTAKDYWLVITATTLTGEKITLGTSVCTVREDGDGSGSGPAAGDPTYYTAAQSDARYVYKAGDTMTGLLQFSGTGHAGIKLNNLTTGQRDALTPSAGMAIYNTTTGRQEFRDTAAWRQYVIIAGDTMTGSLQFSGAGHAGLRLNNLTTTERDALTGSPGMTIYNVTTGTVEFRDASAWYRAARVASSGGVANGVAYWLDGNTLTRDANLTWNGTNFGIGATPNYPFHVKSTLAASYLAAGFQNADSTGYVRLVFDVGAGNPGAGGSAVIKYAPGVFLGIGIDANDTTTPIQFFVNNSTLAWQITPAGNLQSNGSQTIESSSGILTVTGTGGLTLSTAANTNILLSPNGTGITGVTATVRITGQTTPASGAGLELAYGGGIAQLLAFDRTGGLYKPVTYRGLNHAFYDAGGVVRIYVDGSGYVDVTGTIRSSVLTQKSILFAGASGAISQGTIIWDESAKQLGIGITSGIGFHLHIKASAASLGVESTTSTAEIDMINSVGNKCFMIYTGQDLQFRVLNPSTPAITIIGANPNRIAFFGLTTATYDLSLEGNAARTLALERHTTANTAGNNLTLLAGGATSGATDKAGGILKLSGGLSTGSGGSSVEVYVYRAGASGTADNTQTLMASFDPKGRIRGGSSANFASLGGTIHVNTTTVGNVGTGEDDLMTYTLAANTLESNGDRVVIRACGFLANNANVKTIKFHFGSQSVITLYSTNGGRWWSVVIEVIRTTEGGATTWSIMGLDGNGYGAANATPFIEAGSGVGSSAFTSNLTIKFTGEGTSNNDIEQYSMTVEYLPKP